VRLVLAEEGFEVMSGPLFVERGCPLAEAADAAAGC